MGDMADDMIDRMMFPDYHDLERMATHGEAYVPAVHSKHGGSYVPTIYGKCKCGEFMDPTPPNMAGRKFMAGGKPFRVDYYCRRCSYVHVKYTSGAEVAWPVGRLTPVERYSPKLGEQKKTTAKAIFGKGQDMTKKALYETTLNGKGCYAHKLTVNSRGEWVMEEKGTGQVFSVSKDYVTEVMPYTVGVRFANKNGEYNFFAKQGDVNVGDILFIDGYETWARVTALNTRSRRATVWLNGLKVTGAAIVNEGDSEDED